MICIYHNKDLDGYCSGAIVKRKYPDAKLIGYDYGQSFPWEEMTKTVDVIMIDVSLPIDEMCVLGRQVRKLTWIDHHVSAIKEFSTFLVKGKGQEITPVLENGISACEGGWKYLFPDEEMPTAVKLLGEYDTWRNNDKERWDNSVMPFQYGMRMRCSSPETFPEELLSNKGEIGVLFADTLCGKIIENGNLILEYQKTQNERACRSSFEIEFEGLKAIALNNGGANSQVFDSVYDPTKHDVMIPFVFTGKHWTFSLYTTKEDVDCSIIAKSKGGGGHKKAAGFQLKELPDEFKIHVYENATPNN